MDMSYLAGCRCLDRWVCEGVLADPFGEFMVQEDTVSSSNRKAR
jgi:hypothetical protein